MYRVHMRRLLFLPVRFGRGVGAEAPFFLAQPLNFMNRSGLYVPKLLKRTRLSVSHLIIICDNLDLPPGSVRIRRGGSDAGHNGLKSVISSIGTPDFLRIYVGIGRPKQGCSVVDHVLGLPPDPERFNAGISAAAAAVGRFAAGTPVDRVMHEFNAKKS
jgi:peptidyl-tRNA hydrolase, PTH1 family